MNPAKKLSTVLAISAFLTLATVGIAQAATVTFDPKVSGISNSWFAGMPDRSPYASNTQGFSLLSTGSGQIGTIDTATGTFTQLATGPAFWDVALSNDGNFVGIEAGKLYSFNLASRIFSLIGNNGLPIGALGFSTKNVLYGINPGGNFYTIDTATGQASLIANIPGFQGAGDLVFDPETKRILATSYSFTDQNALDQLFSVELNGASYKIGDIGFAGAVALFFENGTLFGYSGSRQIVIDPTTGKGTLQKYVTGLTDSPWGAASLPSTGSNSTEQVPEPSTLFGGVLGWTALVAARRRRKSSSNCRQA